MANALIHPVAAERLMRLALGEAEKGMAAGEIPIGAVLAMMQGGDLGVLSAAHNENILLSRRTAHAEMRAFEKARVPAELGMRPEDPDAPALVLVSTLEPCVMCYAAAMLSAVSLILFGMCSPNDGGVGRVAAVQKPPARVPVSQGGLLTGESRALFETWLQRHKPGDRHWNLVTALLAPLTANMP